MRGVIAAGAVLWLVSTAAGARGHLQTIEVFQTPTRNIACGYVTGLGAPPSLRCDIRSGLRPQPKRACELDWTGVFLGTRGRATATCAGDTVASPRARVLAYGRTWSRGGFTCLSSRIGLMCTNRAGHGFLLSRERWQVS